MSAIHFGSIFLKELETEAIATRKCLERMPIDKLFNWKPHEKSMVFGYLALLVAEMPNWIAYMIRDKEIDLATFPHLQAKTTAELVAGFDEYMEAARQALEPLPNEALQEVFILKSNGQELFRSPLFDSISSTINHWVHHRGQMTVYMRLNDILVPSIYGPSADERTY
ncbi:MAG: DinB family protein [Candidatus Pseudobacter hemicellulosilyticus]|uniref:DinB family protein n=1 Tax=Candidatus Pseudobacter hemicellulosilyticus TaxID=3121375 RepID=A0AAJ5WUN3_9BACT|nr:MAG: DinB family protein [Pseudobacter sp.]